VSNSKLPQWSNLLATPTCEHQVLWRSSPPRFLGFNGNEIDDGLRQRSTRFAFTGGEERACGDRGRGCYGFGARVLWLPGRTVEAPTRIWLAKSSARSCYGWGAMKSARGRRSTGFRVHLLVAPLWGTDIPRVHWKDKRPHERPEGPIIRKVIPSWAWGRMTSEADRHKAGSVRARTAQQRRASDHNRDPTFPRWSPVQ
jgi:hypothetical protein